MGDRKYIDVYLCASHYVLRVLIFVFIWLISGVCVCVLFCSLVMPYPIFKQFHCTQKQTIERKTQTIIPSRSIYLNMFFVCVCVCIFIYLNRFLPGFAPFVDGTVIVSVNANPNGSVTLPIGSAVSR